MQAEESEESREGTGTLRDDELIQLIDGQIRMGKTLEAARALLAGVADGDQLDRVIERFQQEVGGFRILTDPVTMTDPNEIPQAWYRGPQPGDLFWPRAIADMQRRGLDDDAIEAVNTATSRVMCLMDPPGMGTVDTRGLVLGHVQSGKTTNFTGLVAKAADVGYRMIVVLTGMTENLRVQTQWRLNQALVAPGPNDWFETTTPFADFTASHNLGFLITKGGHIIGVLKKNPHRLRRLNNWLDDAGDTLLANCPILLIDDEADQASIDVSRDPDLPSRINREIRRLIDRPKCAYVAYTATPFANLLIDPHKHTDLYPRSFIVDLPRPGDGYLGAEEIFGRLEIPGDDDGGVDGLDMLRQIPDAEADLVRPPRDRDDREAWEPEVPQEMERAIRWFLLATAARRTRAGVSDHSSMLVHTTLYTRSQLDFAPEIEAVLDRLRASVAAGDNALLDELRTQWDEESTRVPSTDFGLSAVGFDDVLTRLSETLDAAEVFVDNYISDRRIVYGADPLTAIVVGGNTLSRGLTLEGLVCSYFVRASSAYDTLLQMGRWFGFRRGWQDLPRIWMTGELMNWFTWLATVEAEIRRDIRRYEAENITPLQFGARIALHPDLAVTAALKMRDAIEARTSFAGTRQQSILCAHRDREWLEANMDAAVRLLSSNAHHEVRVDGGSDARPVLQDVPAAEILDFFDQYAFHEQAFLDARRVADYIRLQNEHGQLTKWNVVVAGTDAARDDGGIDLGLGRNIGRVIRSRMNIAGQAYANIKSLMSPRDWLADHPAAYSAELDHEEIWAVRDRLAPDTGLLVIYPIQARSEPRRTGGKRHRTSLDAVADVIGIGVVFPRTAQNWPVGYVTARLEPGAVDEPEDLDAMTEEDAA